MTAESLKLFWYASPQTFYPLAGKIARICAVLAVLFAIAGLYTGFFVAPTEIPRGRSRPDPRARVSGGCSPIATGTGLS